MEHILELVIARAISGLRIDFSRLARRHPVLHCARGRDLGVPPDGSVLFRYYDWTDGLDSPDWRGREAQVTDMLNRGGRLREI
jgi:hypothetical protein